jgi:hypothetical protein
MSSKVAILVALRAGAVGALAQHDHIWELESHHSDGRVGCRAITPELANDVVRFVLTYGSARPFDERRQDERKHAATT